MTDPSPPVVRKTRDEIAAAYVSEPWWYDLRGFFILTFAYNSTLGEQLRFFGRNFHQRHLELACGTGTLLELTLWWRRWKSLPEVSIVGVDYAESMLAGAMRRFKGRSNMDFLHGDAADMPFPPNTFDSINVANSVHCFPDVRGALAGSFKVLKPGGTMAANVLLYPRSRWSFMRYISNKINGWGIRKGILYTPYEVGDIRSIFLSVGFDVQSESISGNCYNIIVRKPLAPQQA